MTFHWLDSCSMCLRMSRGKLIPSHVSAALFCAAEAESNVKAKSKLNQLHTFVRFSFFISVDLSYGSGEAKANFSQLNAGVEKWFGH